MKPTVAADEMFPEGAGPFMDLEENVQCGISCMARSGILLKPHVVVAHLIKFRLEGVGNHQPMALALDGDGLANIVHKEVRTDDAASIDHISFVDVHIHPEMGLIIEDDCFMNIKAGGPSNLLMDLAANEKAVHVDFFNDFEDLFDDEDIK